jgi:outer membrane protein OmpA-like peptidoglycan-associated protein
MTLNLKRMLYLWAATLLLALCIILPLTAVLRIVAMLLVVALAASAWVAAGRRAQQSAGSAQARALLKSAGRLPVLLVCADGHVQIPDAFVGDPEGLRITRSGVYLSVPDILQLPETVARLTAQHPDCRDRLRVMFVVNAVEHDDASMLAGHIRTFCHQLAVARKSGASLPLMLVTYQQTAATEPVWFSRGIGLCGLSVHDAGACLSVAHWQQAEQHENRLQTCIQVKSAAAWLEERVLPHLTTPVVVCAIAAVAAMPRSVENNLWQQWLLGKIALRRAASDSAGQALPLPDPLLQLLPRRVAHSAGRRASIVALWSFTAVAMVALISSAWQNTRFMRQVTDDLHLYAAITPAERLDQPEFARQEQAINALREDLLLLDGYRRHGEPLSLGLGLYKGEHLRAPLLTAIAGHRTPTVETPVRMADPIRLDSLSLFASGSAQLKPDSTRVLIHALHGIKAQPGWLIVISGHTDSTGGAEHNLQLSRTRAAAVRDWMQRMGDIPNSCFAVQGFGDTQPIASNDLEAGRSANRRVDIRLVPEAEACMSSHPVADVTPPVA